MTRQIKKAIKRGKKTLITELVDKKADRISSGALKEAFDAKDELVVKVVRRAANYIGIGIGSLVNVLSPEIVVLGGGVIEALGDDILPRIERSARKIAFEYAMKDVRIVKAQLGDDAGVIGAAKLAREALTRSGDAATAAVGS